MLENIAKTLIILGIAVFGIGLILLFAGKIPWLGKLPGDILIKRENFTFYFPLATSILISVVLTFIFWLFSKR
ncbi:MAG: DUF2905 domain-containing protein [Thermodesulfovibrionales bacterium]|nr:DUF2905 domain-containing protein [Thermodesulfovibrionales bacterium]